MIVLYMIVFHADFVFVTLGRLRRRLHTGIKDLLFCLAVVHEKNGLKKLFTHLLHIVRYLLYMVI